MADQDRRDRVLAVVRAAAEPLTIEEISAATGLHVNTVRGHLEVLLAAESIAREHPADRRPGRPRWLYRYATPDPSPYQRLAEALSAELAQVQDPALAAATAERWAHSLPQVPPAATPDEAISGAAEALTALGFAAEISPVGDAISVRQCPFAALVSENPVICDIHASLIDSLLEQTGQPVRLDTLKVWAGPGACVATFRRPDLEPERVIRTNHSREVTE